MSAWRLGTNALLGVTMFRGPSGASVPTVSCWLLTVGIAKVSLRTFEVQSVT